MVPLIRTAEEAKEVVKSCKYPPLGNRGFGPMYTHHAFGETCTSEEYRDGHHRSVPLRRLWINGFSHGRRLPRRHLADKQVRARPAYSRELLTDARKGEACPWRCSASQTSVQPAWGPWRLGGSKPTRASNGAGSSASTPCEHIRLCSTPLRYLNLSAEQLACRFS